MATIDEAIKKAALQAVNSLKPMNITLGQVENNNPLSVRIEQKFLLTEKQLFYIGHSLPDYEIGTELTLLRQQGGQRYLILNTISDGSSGGSGYSFIFFGSIHEFPNIGSAKTLYIVKTAGDEAIYRWDDADLRYYLISNNYNNIEVINGGNADG